MTASGQEPSQQGAQSQGKRRSRKETLATLALVLLLLYGSLIVVIWRLGLFDLDAAESDAAVIAAILSLSGVLVTSLLTFFGVLLKHSIDDRNATLAEEVETRLQLDAARSAKLAEEAEARLKLEASTKAIELLTMDDGTPAPQTQQAGALFVLVSLDQFALAVALLGEIWRSGAVSSRAAAAVLNQALLSGETYVQESAATILAKHADLLPYKTEDGANVPACINLSWPAHISYFARQELLRAIALCLLSKSAASWKGHFTNWALLELEIARRSETHPGLEANAAWLLHGLLHSGLDFGPTLSTSEEEFDIVALAAKVDSLEPETLARVTRDFADLAEQIRTTWNVSDDSADAADSG